VNIVYCNGLGSGRTALHERVVFWYLARRGIYATHSHIDWYGGESLAELMEKVSKLVEAKNSEGRVVLVGASAGGSLAVNVAVSLGLPAISICGCLCDKDLPGVDYRSLSFRCFGLGRNLQNLYDSVHLCQQHDLSDHSYLAVVPYFDEVVPRLTMRSGNIATSKVPSLGHNMGIFFGLICLPGYLADLTF
jgi:hypothetical protein